MAVDPILSKLFSLWQVDESSLSDLSLHPSRLSTASYPCYSEREATSGSICSNGGSRQQELQEALHCKQCGHPNEASANWCTECGSAMVDTSMPSANLPVQWDIRTSSGCSSAVSSPPATENNTYKDSAAEIDYKSLHLPNTLNQEEDRNNDLGLHVSDDHTHADDSLVLRHTGYETSTYTEEYVPATSCMSMDGEGKSLSPSKNSKITSSLLLSSQHSPSFVVVDQGSGGSLLTSPSYQRHWGSSGMYMWRKPSSLHKPASHKLTDVNVHSHGDHCNVDLFPVKRTQQIHTGVSVNQVHVSSRTSNSTIDKVRFIVGCVKYMYTVCMHT